QGPRRSTCSARGPLPDGARGPRSRRCESRSLEARPRDTRPAGPRDRSAAEHGARADAWRAVDLGEADPRGPGDLALARLAAQLEYHLVHLAQAGRADRLAVRQAAAVRVDRQAAVQAGGAALDQRLLLGVLAEAGL